MMWKRTLVLLLVLTICAVFPGEAQAKRKRSKRYYPPLTHPVVLWGRTLSQSADLEQRKVAAFKLSQYSQPIFQQDVIKTLIQCMKDPEEYLKVLCTKAMRQAGTKKDSERIRQVLLTHFEGDPGLRSTIVRTFIYRKDAHPSTHEVILGAVNNTKESDELVVFLSYFEEYGSGSDRLVSILTELYKKNSNIKVKRAVVKVLGELGQGQNAIVELLSECVDNKDTPLQLNCLSGLELQAKNEATAWAAVSKTLQSEDPDVLLATLDVIVSLGETPDGAIAKRLVQIIDEMGDPEIQEKAVLSLGVCGDHTESIVNALKKMLEQKTNEASRIAAALVLGKQAGLFPEIPRTLLSKCNSEGTSQSLRTACGLGLGDLEKRALAQANGSKPNGKKSP